MFKGVAEGAEPMNKITREHYPVSKLPAELQKEFAGFETVTLVSDTPRGSWFCCSLVLLLLAPALSFFRSSSFESTRWAESNLGTGSDD